MIYPKIDVLQLCSKPEGNQQNAYLRNFRKLHWI